MISSTIANYFLANSPARRRVFIVDGLRCIVSHPSMIKRPRLASHRIQLDEETRMRPATRKSWKHTSSQHRDGIAAMECAIALPIVVLITFGTIDMCSAMFLKESITIAAYEGARIGVASSGSDEAVLVRVAEVLKGRGIHYGDDVCAISSPGFDEAETLDHVSVTVKVPCEGNLALTGWMFAGRSLDASVTMRKEFQKKVEEGG